MQAWESYAVELAGVVGAAIHVLTLFSSSLNCQLRCRLTSTEAQSKGCQDLVDLYNREALITWNGGLGVLEYYCCINFFHELLNVRTTVN